jgi:hypothetical protein
MKLKKIALMTAASLLVLVGAVTFMPLRAIAGLETPCNYISDLVATNPLSSDLASTGDDHLRCIKSVLKTTFPNINAAVTATDENLNALSAGLTAAGILELEAAAPRLIIDETDAASNERIYDFASSAGQLLGRTRTDADAAGASWITVDRTGTTVDSIALAATALTQTNGTATGAIMKLSSDSTAGTAGLAVCDTDESATNECYFMGMGAGADLQIGKASDAGARATAAISVTSTGTTIDTINLAATTVQINGAALVGSTYSPTASSTVNLDSTPTPNTSQYMRVGNVVTVSGSVPVNATAAANTQFEMTLPVSSNLTGANQLAGSGSVFGGTSANDSVRIQGQTTNDRAVFNWHATSTGSTDLYFTFTYLVN